MSDTLVNSVVGNIAAAAGEVPIVEVVQGNANNELKLKTCTTSESNSTALIPIRKPLLWQIALFASSIVMLPTTSRWLALRHHHRSMDTTTLLKGGIFGLLQDAAISLHALVLVQVSLQLRSFVIHYQCCLSCKRLLEIFSMLPSLFAFLYLTLAPAADVLLLMEGLPRLNRSFLAMFLAHSDQFWSSLRAALTPAMILAVLLYIGVMVLWMSAIRTPHHGDQEQMNPRPRRNLIECSFPTMPKQAPFPLTFRGFTFCASSPIGQALLLSLLVSVMALSLTLALEEHPTRIFLFANAMFALETEPWLQRVAVVPRLSPVMLRGSAQDFRNPIVDRLLGTSERFKWCLPPNETDEYPFWRETLGFTGPKRFAFHDVDPEMLPDVLLINLESFRSREVGVLGGQAIKEATGQTVTPNLDALSETGVLFRQHYTSSVQTSRSMLSTLFGVVASLAYDSVVQMFDDKPLRFRSLAEILRDVANYKTVFWSAVDLSWDNWHRFFSLHGFTELHDEVSIPKILNHELEDGDGTTWGLHDRLSFDALTEFLTQRAKDASQASAERSPLFLNMLTVSSHDPFEVPSNFERTSNFSEFVTADNREYLDALHFVDQELGSWVRTMRERGLMKNTIVLIQGDHGYGRMEHDNTNLLASRVFDEGMHVPMLLLADDFLSSKGKGLTVDAITSQYDILATVLDMLQLEYVKNHGMGQSMLRKAAENRPVLMGNPYYGVPTGLRVGELKYIVDQDSDGFEVYNITEDPHELHELESSIESGGTTHQHEVGFMVLAMRYVQALYSSNGFMPATSTSARKQQQQKQQKQQR